MGEQALSATFDATMHPELWRTMTGRRVCEVCGTPVALFTVCEEDDEGSPINDRPTGEKRWIEVADPPALGQPHTPDRCSAAAPGRAAPPALDEEDPRP